MQTKTILLYSGWQTHRPKQANTYKGHHTCRTLTVVISKNNANRNENQGVNIFIWLINGGKMRKKGKKMGGGWQAAGLVAGKNTSRVG